MGYRSHATASSTTGTLTCNKPAGVVSGDVLVAIIGYWNSAAPITPPSGWTLGDSGANGGNAGAWYWKVAGGSEPSTYGWTFGGSVDESHVVLAAYTGVDNTTPVDVSSKKTDSTGDGGLVATGVTMTGAGTLLFLAGSNAGYVISAPMAPPSGMTERAQVFGVEYGAAYLADQEVAAAGATGNKTATAESGTNTGPYTTFLVALKVSAGGGGGGAKRRRIHPRTGSRLRL